MYDSHTPTQSLIYLSSCKNRHAILVLRRDWELFTGEVMFANIPDKSIEMPGPIKLDIKVQDIMARFGVNPSPQDMSLLLESKLAPWE
jgi:hypothetical protein